MWKLAILASYAFMQAAAQPMSTRRVPPHVAHPRAPHLPRVPENRARAVRGSPAVPVQSPTPVVLPFGSVNIQKPQLQCPRHYVLTGTSCVRSDDRPLRSQCPPRAKLENGVCVVEKVIPPRQMCPEGSVLAAGKCTITETTSPIVKCPRDHVLRDAQCIKTHETRAAIMCPPGYRNNIELRACAREVRGSARFTCPDGSNAARDGHCAVEAVADPILRCERGFVLQENGKCVKDVGPSMVCPPGFKRDGEACMRHFRADPQAVCPDGQTYDGRSCVSTVTSAVQLHCDRDFELRDGKCVKVIEHPPRVDCAAGYHYEIAREGPICLSVARSKAELYCPSGKLVGRRCDVTESAEPVPESGCSPGTTDESCYREPRVSCPRGHRLDDQRCVSRNDIKAEAICPAGFTLKGRDCVQMDTVPFITECRSGGELSGTGSCVRVDTTELQSLCPKTYKMMNDRCVLTREFSPVEACPAGSIQSGRKCTATERVAPKVACTGTSSDAADCLPMDTREPRMVCSRDFRLVGDVCVSRRGDAGGDSAAAAGDAKMHPARAGHHGHA